MKVKLLIISLLLPVLMSAQVGYNWHRTLMDGSRTGVVVPGENNVKEALGTVDGKVYTAPNGRSYCGGAISKVAATVIDAQGTMAEVKRVVAYSENGMRKRGPESPLSNWFADLLIACGEQIYERKVDVSIANFGGIRVNMPQGDVLVDDIRSMFPFRNDVVYMSIKGSDLRSLLESFASGKMEVLGGVRLVIKNRKLVSAEVGGKPLDDNKLYGLVTISFLMNGGDNLFLERYAQETLSKDVDIYTAVMAQVEALTAAGVSLDNEVDGRIKILED